MELSVEKRSPKVNIDLTGLDLNQYRRLDIYASLNVASPGERIALRCNGMENVYRWSGIDNQWMDALCNFTMIPDGSYGSSLVSLYLAPGMICLLYTSPVISKSVLPHAGKIAKSGLCPAIVSGLGRSVNGQKRPRYGRFRGFLNIFHKKRCLVKIDGPRTLYTSSGAL